MSALRLAVIAFLLVVVGTLLSMSPVGWVMVPAGWIVAVMAMWRAGRAAEVPGNRPAIAIGAVSLVLPIALIGIGSALIG